MTTRQNSLGHSGSPDRPTIGFLVDSVQDEFQATIWKSIVDAAESFDVNLLLFIGGVLWRTEVDWSITNLISKENVSGLVILSGVMASYLSDGDFHAHLQCLPQVPTVSISKSVPGIPSLIVDNEIGFRQLLEHLIVDHGRRRIAFIRGSETNVEAETRYRVYRESLQQHGLPFEPARVFLGDFTGDSGLRAIHAFVDSRNIDFDAVVGANDHMVVFAMKELQRRGVRIPEDVCVAGFDDIQDAISVTPELTTIRQPLREMGRAAIRTILAMLRGEPVEELTSFPTSLVIRRSCGCMDTTNDERRVRHLKSKPTKTDDPNGRPDFASLFKAHFPRNEQMRLPTWAEDLADSLSADLNGTESRRFLPLLEKTVTEGFAHNVGATEWYGALSGTFEAVRPHARRGQRKRLARLLESSLILVGRIAERAQIALRTKSQEELKILPWVLSAGQIDEETIKREIMRDLPTLGIPSFYFSCYADERHEYASLFVHYSFSRCVVLDDPLQVFPVGQLIPGRFTAEPRHAFAVILICPQSAGGGFALCEISAIEPVTYEFLMNQISAAIRVTTLMNEVRQYASQLEVKVEERTRQLKDVQQQLVDTAHQAGMVEIAIELIHNVGNLLNSVSISAEEILSTVKSSKIEGLMKANDLLASRQSGPAADESSRLLFDYYGKITEHLKDERFLIQDEVVQLLAKTKLIRDTIKSLRDYAEGATDNLSSESIPAPAVVDAALRIQESRLADRHIQVRKELETVPPIIGQRVKVVHVLVSVIKNAFEAMGATPEDERRLEVSVRRDAEGGVLIRIADTGEGIAEKNLTKVFAHGFTTKTDNHGFSLHTCANYMAQMGGSIKAESNGPGRGAAFTMAFRADS